MMYTKELIFSEFKEVTKKDEKYKKPTYTNRIAYLTAKLKKISTTQQRSLFENQIVANMH